MFDVGIAEQHAVTFAAGLTTEGYKPFAAIYSTLQRAYDQVVHDAAFNLYQLDLQLIVRDWLEQMDLPTQALSI